MLYVFFISFFIITNPNLSQARVTALGETTQHSEFQEYLKNTPGAVSLKDQIIRNKIKKSDAYIKSKYSLAVKGLLLDDLTPSKYLFKELAGLKKTHLFSKKTKNFISESYYRLSNLERTKTNFWVKEGLLFDLNYTPSSTVFNPDIISSFKSQKTEISNYSFKFNIKKIADLNTNVFINGSLISNDSKIHPSSTYHLKLFKEGFKEKSFKLSGQELIRTKKIHLQKLNFGTCKAPEFKTVSGVKVTEIFFSKNCIKRNNLVEKEKPIFAQKTFKKDILKNPISKKGLFKKRSTWIVIAGTVVASAIIYSLANQKKDVRIVPVQK